METLSKEERKRLLEEIKEQELERAKKFQQKLHENGWHVSLDDAQTLLEIAEDFLKEE